MSLLLLIQHGLYGGEYVADATVDCIFQVNGVEATFKPDSSKDCVFQVNGLALTAPETAVWVPNASVDCVFQVNADSQVTATEGSISAAYPSPNSAYSQTYLTPPDGTNRRLTSVEFTLQKGSTWTGTLQAEVYAHSGTYGESSVPTGDALAVSTILTEQDLTVTSTATVFPFIGSNQIMLPPATTYVFVLKILTSNGVSPAVTVSYTSSSTDGNAAIWTN